MNFEEVLYGLPAERLKEIVATRVRTFRGVPRISNKKDLVKFLAGALSSYDSIHSALYQTSLLELKALTAVVARGGEIPIADLGPSNPDAKWDLAARAIDGLEKLGLAFRAKDLQNKFIYVPKAVRNAAPVPLALKCRLQDALARMDMGAVTHIHEYLELPMPPAPNRRALAVEIARELSDPIRVKHRVTRLSPDANATLQRILANGGDIVIRDFAATLDARLRNQILGYGWPAQWHSGKPRNCVEELLSNGLIVIEHSQGWMNWNLVTPGEVFEILTGAPALQDALPVEPAVETISPQTVSRHLYETGLRDAAFILGFLDRTEAPSTAAGRMHRNTIKTLAKGMSEPGSRCAEFLYVLLHAEGLIAPSGKKQQFAMTAEGKDWLSLARAEQVRALYERWRKQDIWDERFVSPGGTRRSYYDRTSIQQIRDDAVDLHRDLTSSAPDDFASILSLANRAHYRGWARFRFGDEQTSVDESPPAHADDPDTTVSSNASLLRNIYAESLYFLGLTELHFGPSGIPTHVRLSPLGRHILLDEPLGQPAEDEQKFVIQPNLEIYASPRLPTAILQRLFRIAEPSGPGVIHISRSAIRGALDRGESLDSLLKFLNANSRTGIPQNVEYLLREVGSKHGHIRIGQAGLYIKVDDPLLLKEIRALKSVDIHFREELSDTVALIAGSSVDTLLKQLRQAGYLPVAAEQANGKRNSRRDLEDEEEIEDEDENYYRAPVYQPRRETPPPIDWDAILASEA